LHGQDLFINFEVGPGVMAVLTQFASVLIGGIDQARRDGVRIYAIKAEDVVSGSFAAWVADVLSKSRQRPVGFLSHFIVLVDSAEDMPFAVSGLFPIFVLTHLIEVFK